MSTNISKQKRDDLLAKIEQIKTYIQKSEFDKNTTNLLQYLNELTKEVNGKKYGLVFEDHREKIDEQLKNSLPVFSEEKDLFIGNGGQMNFLIEGDNLASLKLLEKTHKGKIDLIYIDPPYNTGNKDFVYDDSFVSDDDEFKHSKWLSFMEKRLKIARNLLSKNGCILLSIDKNEGFQLKLLLDEIFGEESFAADLHVETSVIAGPRRFAAVNGSIVKTTEFILGYTHNGNCKIIAEPTFDYISGFDNHYSLYWDNKKESFVKFVEILKSSEKIKGIFSALNLKISLNNFSKVINADEEIKQWLYNAEIAGNLFRESDTSDDIPKNIISKLKPNTLFEYNNVFYRINSDYTANILFRYLNRIGQCDDYFESFGERSIRGNLWKGFSADGGNLAKEGGVSFKNGKKPKRLIKQLIKTITGNAPRKNITILDFFAGSGTTGEAVLELNKTDKSHRKFILCTNNENNICKEITYQRIKTAITGNRKDGSKYSDGLPGSLKYFRVDFIPITEKEYYEYADKLLLHIRELVELENAVNFSGNKKIAIVLTDKELEEFCSSIIGKSECHTAYIGHDVLLTKEQKSLFRENNIKIKIIPEYYYPELNG